MSLILRSTVLNVGAKQVLTALYPPPCSEALIESVRRSVEHVEKNFQQRPPPVS